MQDGYVGLLPDDIIKRPKMAFQDGMDIKKEFELVLDNNPKKCYSEIYKNIFGV